MTRIYGSIWMMVAAMAGLLYVSGYWGLRSFFVLGVFTVGLIFIGIMGVLPTTIVDHPEPKQRNKTDTK